MNDKIIKGFFWQGLERIGTYGIGFVVSIILARLLSPDEFGVVAIMMVFITLSNVFIDSGFSTALIQKKEMEQADCCSAFYINIVMSLVLYGILFLASPFIADFYETPELVLYLHVFSLILIIRSFSIVQMALLRKRMLFHLSFRIIWVALIVSGCVGIAMAYFGCGVWSLIVQQLTQAIVTAIMQWYLVKWRPQWLFDWERTKQMFDFGWKMFCASFLNTLYNDIYTVIFGKIADMETVSYYDRGKQYPQYGMNIINSTMIAVLFPAFSEIQDDRKKMRKLAERGLKCSLFLVAPSLAFLFAFADSITILLLTEKWLPSAIFIRLCCFSFFFWPFNAVNKHVITACGYSGVILIVEIIKKVQGILGIAITYRFGVVIMVAASGILGLFDMIETAWYNKKLIDYAPWQQLWDIVPIVMLSALAAAFGYFITLSIHNALLKLVVGALVFCITYLVSTFLTHVLPQEIVQIIKKKVFKA